MSTAMSKAESNALVVSYDVLGTHVELDLDFVKKYLVRGKAELVSNQELVFFMNTCRQQKLNPLAQGEVYLIKYSEKDPAQMVVGKDAYLRRAFEHPDYLFKQDGITVLRGDQIFQKEGCCLYPGESLVGGWCRVYFMRNGKERTAFKEVSFGEYNKGQANWQNKPATMINKVAISQCVRDAFPKDYEGVYSEDEMVASGAIPVNYKELDDQKQEEQPAEEEDPVISQEQRQQLLRSTNEDAQWLIRIVENLLSITRISSEEAKVKKEPEPAEEVIESAVAKTHKHYPEVDIRVHLPDELMMVPMDPLLMEQVLVNLMENAVIHGETHHIDVTLSSEGNCAVFTVADDGRGIPQHLLPRLFDGSARSDRSSDGKRSMGIGLSVCRTIVLAHGGVIRGDNRQEGGAVFTVTLPMKGENDED